MAGLMVLVAVVAGTVNHVRPVHQAAAVQVAEARFRSLPTANLWAGQTRSESFSTGEFWVVDFRDTRDERLLAQIAGNRRGQVCAVATLPRFRQKSP